jgi:hypothetical protein
MVAGTPMVTGLEAGLVVEPAVLLAVTVNVYATPLASPVTVTGDPAVAGDDTGAGAGPVAVPVVVGVAVTTYDVAAGKPGVPGVNATTA